MKIHVYICRKYIHINMYVNLHINVFMFKWRSHSVSCFDPQNIANNDDALGTLADACCWARSWAWAHLQMHAVEQGMDVDRHTCRCMLLGKVLGVDTLADACITAVFLIF